MTQLNTINPTSGLEEWYTVSDEKYDPKSDKLLKYFSDNDKVEEIIKIIESRKFTTKELESLIWEISLSNMKTKLNEYLALLKKTEKDIAKYLQKKWLIDKNIDIQTIKLNFIWTDFKWLGAKMMKYLAEYNLNKWSFNQELEKVDDEKWKYSINIVLEKSKNVFVTKDIYIQKEN